MTIELRKKQPSSLSTSVIVGLHSSRIYERNLVAQLRLGLQVGGRNVIAEALPLESTGYRLRRSARGNREGWKGLRHNEGEKSRSRLIDHGNGDPTGLLAAAEVQSSGAVVWLAVLATDQYSLMSS